jgi:hypothetical protein
MATFERLDCILSIGHIIELLAQDVNGILSLGQNTIQWAYGLDDNADRGMRRLRTPVDTRNGEPAELSVKAVSLNIVEQRRR